MLEIDGLTFYTVDEICENLGLGPDAVRRMVRDGRIDGRKLGRRWLIEENALKDALKPKSDVKLKQKLMDYIGSIQEVAKKTGFLPKTVTYHHDGLQITLNVPTEVKE